jgi:hypothetical protein
MIEIHVGPWTTPKTANFHIEFYKNGYWLSYSLTPKSMGTNVVITIILWRSIHAKKTMGGNLCMEWKFFVEWKRKQVKIHVQHLFDNLLAPTLLFPWFCYSNPILKLELVKEVGFPYYQPPLQNIWIEIYHIWDFF